MKNEPINSSDVAALRCAGYRIATDWTGSADPFVVVLDPVRTLSADGRVRVDYAPATLRTRRAVISFLAERS